MERNNEHVKFKEKRNTKSIDDLKGDHTKSKVKKIQASPAGKNEWLLTEEKKWMAQKIIEQQVV